MTRPPPLSWPFAASLRSIAEASCTGLGQPQRLAPAITAPPLDGDQTVTLQRQDIPSEGGAVHDHIRGKGVDRHRSQSPRFSQYRKLRRAQPARCQKLIVELCDVPGGLAHGEAVAILWP